MTTTATTTVAATETAAAVAAGGRPRKRAAARPRPSRARRKKKVVAPSPRAAGWLLGAVMPVFSVAMSGIAGSLAVAGAWAAFAVVAVAGLSGLAVSLEHVAGSIARVTGSAKRESWALAVGLELGIVGIEVARVTAPEVVSEMTALLLVSVLAALVAGANILAFEAHRAALEE